jgi:hypothetical protein
MVAARMPSDMCMMTSEGKVLDSFMMLSVLILELENRFQ